MKGHVVDVVKARVPVADTEGGGAEGASGAGASGEGEREEECVTGAVLADGTVVPAEVVVFCTGPWTCSTPALLPALSRGVVSGLRAHR